MLMKKYSLQFFLLLTSVVSFAQEGHSKAYNTGYAIGKIFGYVLIAALLIWGIRKLLKK